MINLIVIVIFAIPLSWSVVVAGLRSFRKALVLDDVAEKSMLAILLAPVPMGAVLVCLTRCLPVHLPLPLPLMAPADFDGPMMGPVVAVNAGIVQQRIDLASWLPVCALLAYCLVAAVLALRLVKTSLGLMTLAKATRPATHLGEGVRVSPQPLSPMAWGARSIILPQVLVERMSPSQIALIVHHERAHINRRDPHYFAVLAWIDVLFWFNPFIRHQTRQCRLAAELACDAAVTAASPDMRGAYAETLVMALKHAAGNARQCVPAAFSPAKSGDYRMRISEIMHPDTQRRKPRLWPVATACLLLAPVGVAQLAWSQSPVKVKAATTTAPARFFSLMPVTGRLSSGYGMRKNPLTGAAQMHEGIDITTPIGTPVYAPASGLITRADVAEPGYGKVLEIDHGNGFVTRYMHLGDFEVKVGDQVNVGQLVAKSGNTGKSTGPHVHIGVFKDGEAVDPASVLPMAVARLEEAAPLEGARFRPCAKENPEPCTVGGNQMTSDRKTLTAVGDVWLKTGVQTIHADYLRMERETGAVTLRGKIWTEPNSEASTVAKP